MQHIVYPSSDKDRVLNLQRIIETGRSDLANGRSYLPQRLLDEATTREAMLRPHYEALDKAKSYKSQKIEERNNATAALETAVRAFRDVAMWKQKLEHLPASYLLFFEIGTEQMKNGNVYDWAELAHKYSQGEANALAAGYTAVPLPTSIQLNTLRDQALARAKEVDNADRDLDIIQQTLSDLRPATDKLLRAISAQLNASLYDLPNDDIRRIKRTYGFVYAEVATTDTSPTPEASTESEI